MVLSCTLSQKLFKTSMLKLLFLIKMTEQQRLKAEKALEKVVEAIYGYEGTYPDQVYNQLHECLILIGKRLEPHKPKKGSFHAIFYMCYNSDSGMPETPNTAYTVLTTIFRALNAINQKLITLDETFITKGGYVNTDYFYVGAVYSFPTSKGTQQKAKENYHEWFDNIPLNKILEQFIDLMNEHEDKAQKNKVLKNDLHSKPNESETSEIKEEIEDRPVHDTSNDELRGAQLRFKQIKNDIKALKQIKHNQSIDEQTKQEIRDTIKSLKTQKSKLDEKLKYVQNLKQNETKLNEEIEARRDEQRKRIVEAAFKRIRLMANASRNSAKKGVVEQKIKNDILPNEQIESNNTMTEPFSILRIYDVSPGLNDINKWSGYDVELDLVIDGLRDENVDVPDNLQELFDREFIGTLADAYHSGTLSKEKALDILETDYMALIDDESRINARELLHELRSKPKQASIKSTSKSPSRSTPKRSTSRSTATSRSNKVHIDVTNPKITATYDNRRDIATIKPVFKAKLTF